MNHTTEQVRQAALWIFADVVDHSNPVGGDDRMLWDKCRSFLRAQKRRDNLGAA
jgi:hypothetical protein